METLMYVNRVQVYKINSESGELSFLQEEMLASAEGNKGKLSYFFRGGGEGGEFIKQHDCL